MTDSQIPEFHKHTAAGTPEKPVLVVLDEAHLWFNARDWNSTSRELLAFLTQSRKQSTDVIFISQSLLNMDKQFMRLVQVVWTFCDLKVKGYPINLVFWQSVPWPFPQILQQQFDSDGKTVLNRRFLWKDSKLFACYNTFVLLRGFPRLESLKSNYSGEGRRKPTVLEVARRFAFVPVSICLLIVMCGCRFIHVDDVRKENETLKKRIDVLEKSLKALASRPVPSVSSNVPCVFPEVRPLPVVSGLGSNSPVYRVVAVVGDGSKTRVCLSDGVWYSVGDDCPALGILTGVSVASGNSVWARGVGFPPSIGQVGR